MSKRPFEDWSDEELFEFLHRNQELRSILGGTFTFPELTEEELNEKVEWTPEQEAHFKKQREEVLRKYRELGPDNSPFERDGPGDPGRRWKPES
jgi:hypothetical protein